MKVQVKKLEHFKGDLPAYATKGAAGMDLRAQLGDKKNVMIFPGGRMLVPTGLAVAVPEGFEMQVRPRSGLALKSGITVLNSPGTVDSDYRGEVGVILMNTTSESFVIMDGDRIAQAVFAPVVIAEFEEVAELPSTDRGAGGFGSSGVK